MRIADDKYDAQERAPAVLVRLTLELTVAIVGEPAAFAEPGR